MPTSVVAFKTQIHLSLPDSGRVGFVFITANQRMDQSANKSEPTKRTITKRELLLRIQFGKHFLKLNFFFQYLHDGILKINFFFSVPARWKRHNDGQLAACGSNGGRRLAGKRQDERCCKSQDHNPAGNALSFSYMSFLVELYDGNVLGGQIDWIELVAFQVNDAVPELVNNTGLTLWAGSTVPIR